MNYEIYMHGQILGTHSFLLKGEFLQPDGNSLIYGIKEENAYTAAIIIAVIATVLCLIISIPIFNKKQL